MSFSFSVSLSLPLSSLIPTCCSALCPTDQKKDRLFLVVFLSFHLFFSSKVYLIYFFLSQTEGDAPAAAAHLAAGQSVRIQCVFSDLSSTCGDSTGTTTGKRFEGKVPSVFIKQQLSRRHFYKLCLSFASLPPSLVGLCGGLAALMIYPWLHRAKHDGNSVRTASNIEPTNFTRSTFDTFKLAQD